MALVRLAIALVPELADEEDIPLGSTKLWGLPHVQSGFDWPIHEGMMLGFLGQVNLAELKNCHDLGLPSHGLLSFWFHQGLNDGEGPVCGKIFHFLDSDLTLSCMEQRLIPKSIDISYEYSFIHSLIMTAGNCLRHEIYKCWSARSFS